MLTYADSATGGSVHTNEEEEVKEEEKEEEEEQGEEDAAAERGWGVKEWVAVRVVGGELGVGLAKTEAIKASLLWRFMKHTYADVCWRMLAYADVC
jgi:hypothetical protein